MERGLKDLQDRNLLVISHSYNSFQKNSINSLSPYFKSIYTTVRTNPIAELSNFIPLSSLNNSKLSNKIDLSNKPNNVQVKKTPISYMPLDISYKLLGEKHLKVVKKVLEKDNPAFDSIHAHFAWSSGFVGVSLKDERGVPLVVTAHGYDVYSLPFKDLDWNRRVSSVLNNADHIITVSESNKRCIDKLKIDTPVSVLPNGYDDNLFRPIDKVFARQQLGLHGNKIILVSIGNLVPVKGHEYLIRSFSKIAETNDSIVLHIIGDGKLFNSLLRLINSLDLKSKIFLHGNKPHSEIPLWINASDLIVLPSLNEGNPTVMFESLGCGVPFIGSKVGGIPEIINSEDYGLTVEPGNSDLLSDKILLALDKDWNSEQIINYAKKFSIKTIAKNVNEIHQRLIE